MGTINSKSCKQTHVITWIHFNAYFEYNKNVEFNINIKWIKLYDHPIWVKISLTIYTIKVNWIGIAAKIHYSTVPLSKKLMDYFVHFLELSSADKPHFQVFLHPNPIWECFTDIWCLTHKTSIPHTVFFFIKNLQHNVLDSGCRVVLTCSLGPKWDICFLFYIKSWK